MNVLAVVAHPDDEVLGCGGTLCRHAVEGDSVFVAVMAQGWMSRLESREEDPEAEKALGRLREHAGNAAAVLGVKDMVFYDFPDNRMDGSDLLDIIKSIEGCIKRFSPQVVYTHHEGDLNIDHKIVSKAVVTATRPYPGQPVQEVYSFEVLSSTEWAFQEADRAFVPNYFVDIHRNLHEKLAAMSAYESEIGVFPHPRSPEAIRALATLRGSQSGLEAAEAFKLIRRILK